MYLSVIGLDKHIRKESENYVTVILLDSNPFSSTKWSEIQVEDSNRLFDFYSLVKQLKRLKKNIF